MVTVNDYLAKRDADWMGRIYRFPGHERRASILVYEQDNASKIAYAPTSPTAPTTKYGFDYLRDNMEYAVADRRQRGLNYAIVDEVDSILIDEARTPLIISGPTEDNIEIYYKINGLAPDPAAAGPKSSSDDALMKGPSGLSVTEKTWHQSARRNGLICPPDCPTNVPTFR